MLFSPAQAKELILVSFASQAPSLQLAAFASVFLGAVSIFASTHDLGAAFFYLFLLAAWVSSISFSAWVFGSQRLAQAAESFDRRVSRFIVFLGLAQAPLVLLAAFDFWAGEPLDFSFFKTLLLLWTICLSFWATGSAWGLGSFQTFSLALRYLFRPFTIIFQIVFVVMVLSFLAQLQG